MYNSQEWPTRIFFYSYDDMPKTAGSRPKVVFHSMSRTANPGEYINVVNKSVYWFNTDKV